jgi:hypothetical protein
MYKGHIKICPFFNAIKKTLFVSIITKKILGNVLSSLTLLSALKCLTTVFGMGTGVSTSLFSPRKY